MKVIAGLCDDNYDLEFQILILMCYQEVIMRYLWGFLLGAVLLASNSSLPVFADSRVGYQDFRSYAQQLGEVFPQQPTVAHLKRWTELLLRMYLWSKDSFSIQQEPEQELLRKLTEILEKLKDIGTGGISEQYLRALNAALALLKHDYQQAEWFVNQGPKREAVLRLISVLLGEEKPEFKQYRKISVEQARALSQELPDSVLAHSILVESLLENSSESEDSRALLMEAAALLKRNLQQEPNNLFLRYQQAQVHFLLGQKETAYREFQELLSLKQVDYRLPEAIANFYVWNKEDRLAEAAYARALHINPDQLRLYRKLEQVYLRLDEPLKAAQWYVKGLERQPAQVEYYWALKDLSLKTNLDDMLKLIQPKALKTGSYYLSVFQADLYALKEDWQQAAHSYKRAIDLKPILLVAHEGFLQILWKQQDLNAFQQHLKTMRKQPELVPFTHYWMGLLHLQNQEPVQAMAELEKASLKDQAVRRALVVAYRQNKQWEQAKALVQQMLKTTPKDIQLLVTMGDIYAEEKNLAKAEEYYLWAHKLDSYNTNALFSLGNLYSETGRSQLAQEAFERVILLNPEDLDARNNLGNVLLKERKFKEAVQHFEKILRINPEYAAAYYNIACAYALTWQKEAALDYLQKALERDQQLKHLAIHDPDFDNLRQDRLFQMLIK